MTSIKLQMAALKICVTSYHIYNYIKLHDSRAYHSKHSYTIQRHPQRGLVFDIEGITFNHTIGIDKYLTKKENH